MLKGTADSIVIVKVKSNWDSNYPPIQNINI